MIELLGSIGSALGSIGTSLINKSSVEETNQANALQAQLNREFQERMSSTAYQRGMADMRASGLNPILAYQKGGASSPSGSQAAMQPFEIKGNPVSDAINTGMGLMRQKLENANKYAENFNIQADTALKDATARRTAAETSIREANLSPAELEKIKADEDKKVYETKLGSTARRAGTYSDEISRTTDTVLNSAKKVGDIISPFRSYGQETVKSGSRWTDKHTGENHYQDQIFSKRWPQH